MILTYSQSWKNSKKNESEKPTEKFMKDELNDNFL